LKIDDWIKVEEAFTQKFGWNRGIGMITFAHKEVIHKYRLNPNTGVEMLTKTQTVLLKTKLRRQYESH